MDISMHFRINSPKVIHETIDGETVIVNLDSGNYYSLDAIGAEIWEYIVRNVSIPSIIEIIASGYTGEQEEIQKTVHQFIDEMQRENLIAVNESQEFLDVSEADVSPEKGANQSKEYGVFIPPMLNKYSDMQDLLLLDPIHEVDDTGWPNIKTENA